jgi:hypothetical protein
VRRALEYNLVTLRISRAFVSLLCRPNNDAKGISLAWIGDYEIRMQAAAAPTNAVEQPLFAIGMFDHDAQRFIDSRACYSLSEGAVAFEAFLLAAEPVADTPH